MPLDNEEQIKRIWDAFEREAEERRKAAAEFAKEMKELAAEREKRAAESDKKREERAAEFAKEMKELAAEREKRATEFAKEMKELAAERAERVAELDKRTVERDVRSQKNLTDTERKSDEIWRKLDSVSEKHGGYVNIAGLILEDDFFAALGDKKQVGGIVLDTVCQRLRHHYEYDLVGINGDAVVVGEVKRNFRVEDVVKFTDKILPHFAKDFPQHAHLKTFGMIAGENIMPEAEQEAKKRGLFILRLRNKSLVVGNAEQAKPIGCSALSVQ